MSMITAGLLSLGLLFPALSLLTFIAARLTQWRTGRHVSAVLIPFVGPMLLTPCVFIEDWSYWLIPVFWGGDLGTLFFLFISPSLISEWWRTSHFTRCLSLHGHHQNQTAKLTLHSTGHYYLCKKWPISSSGMISLSEDGTYEKIDDRYELTSHFGLRRTLLLLNGSDPASYSVIEVTFTKDNWKDYSLAEWTLQSDAT